MVLGFGWRPRVGYKGAVGFAGAFKGECRGSREGARSGKGRRSRAGRCAAGDTREEERKEEEALPGGVGVREEERGKRGAERARPSWLRARERGMDRGND
jgi:hypothetical protein